MLSLYLDAPSTLIRFQTKTKLFSPDTAIVHTRTPKTITENSAIRKRSPEWTELKTMVFERCFVGWVEETMLSENGDVIKIDIYTYFCIEHTGTRPLDREYI